jgi:small subunit ribosomal protein S11
MAKQQQTRGGGRARTTRKKIQVESNGAAYVKATFNNVVITLTDSYGNTIAWSSAGKMGFRGSRKNTPYAATVAASDAAKEAYRPRPPPRGRLREGPRLRPRECHPRPLQRRP